MPNKTNYLFKSIETLNKSIDLIEEVAYDLRTKSSEKEKMIKALNQLKETKSKMIKDLGK